MSEQRRGYTEQEDDFLKNLVQGFRLTIKMVGKNTQRYIIKCSDQKEIK
jgi:hypothetical protein